MAWAGCVAYPCTGAKRRPEVRDGREVETPMPFSFPYNLNLIINAEFGSSRGEKYLIMEVIIGLVILGALVGFFFSKKGNEKEGAIQGAKFSCGCIFTLILLAIAAWVILVFMVGGAI